MTDEHQLLISEYEKYKEELSDYDKKMYFYNSKIEEYAETIIKQITELSQMGVSMDVIKKYADANGNIDLTNIDNVKGMINDIYDIYNKTVSEGLKLLENRNN